MDQAAFWTNRYASVGEEYLFGVEVNAYLKSHRDLIVAQGKSAFLVGDGEGRNSVWLAQQGLNVTACDISALAIEKAQKLSSCFNVNPQYLCMDMLAADLDEILPNSQFDWVIGVFIQFTNSLTRVEQFNRMKKLTKPGGFILLLGYTPKQLEYKTGGPSLIENLYTEDMLKVAFADWKIDELKVFESELSEGMGHQGISALIGMIAQKPI
jgi:SAM-dependent methyltransferase